MAKNHSTIETRKSRGTELLWRLVGAYVRLSGATAAGRALMEMAGTAAGALLVETGAFGMKKSESPSPAEVVDEWCRVLDAVDCRYERGAADDESAELFVLECPARLGEVGDRRVCIAGMSADREVVRRLGGELVIGDTIGAGADRCHLKVVRRGNG